MLIDVHTSEVESIKYCCALSDVKVSFMQTEYEGIVKALITHEGREISPELAWRLCASAEAKRVVDKNERHHISEHELMPLINDLP